MPSMTAEACADRFLTSFVRYHGWPASIVSNRGTNWTGDFWSHVCKSLGVNQLLSTAYHPQTDGGTERLNQKVQAALRAYINYQQSDWDKWLPAVQLALNSRPHSTIGISPFFANHGYEPSSVVAAQGTETTAKGKSPKAKATQFVQKLAEVTDLCQAAIASAQQLAEKHANQKKRPAERYAVGDKVWLNLENFESQKPKKKLDWKRAKVTITKVIGPNIVEVEGLPSGAYNRFNVDRIRKAYNDPVPGQQVADPQPPAIVMDGEQEWFVESIEGARTITKYNKPKREAFVHWREHLTGTWEPIEKLAETEALDAYEAKYGDIMFNDNDPTLAVSPKRKRSAKKRTLAQAEEALNGDTLSGTNSTSRGKRKGKSLGMPMQSLPINACPLQKSIADLPTPHHCLPPLNELATPQRRRPLLSDCSSLGAEARSLRNLWEAERSDSRSESGTPMGLRRAKDGARDPCKYSSKAEGGRPAEPLGESKKEGAGLRGCGWRGEPLSGRPPGDRNCKLRSTISSTSSTRRVRFA
ncbi:hypothetical protein RB595_007982 [Gaeumannomyces hyphopodioides]